mmetsp:Transcript_28072/g.85773  ORF Transcript_28072/g.85773 Transcript_28072/m.85773 type:complete len:110 (+) Transcript_28072:395-724(+)
MDRSRTPGRGFMRPHPARVRDEVAHLQPSRRPSKDMSGMGLLRGLPAAAAATLRGDDGPVIGAPLHNSFSTDCWRHLGVAAPAAEARKDSSRPSCRGKTETRSSSMSLE